MQNNMRAEKRKSLKRGKKKGKGRKKAAKAKEGKKARRNKRSILKGASPKKSQAKPKAKAKAKAKAKPEETEPEAKAAPAKSRTKRKAAAEGKAKPAPKTSAKKPKQTAQNGKEGDMVNQERIGSGKYWNYVVLKGQTLGCRSCRYIYNGCGHCRKASFKGKRAQDAYVEQQASIKKAKHAETQQASPPSELMEEQASGSHDTPVHKKRSSRKKAQNVD